MSDTGMDINGNNQGVSRVKSPSEFVISFIIPVLNGEEYIDRCLDHIIREMDDGDEIIVVDNGSTDRTREIAGQYKGIQLLHFPGITIAALRNRGAAIARGDLFAFIDSDCLVSPGWRHAVESVMRDDNIHATGSLYYPPDKATWVESAWFSMRLQKRENVHYIVSGNLIVRRQTFEDIKGFNENLITDEDSDFGVRLNNSGFKMAEAPDISVVHLGNPKNIRQFYHKVSWHAIGGVKLHTDGNIDKPMIMTALFMACSAMALILPALMPGKMYQIWLIPLLLFLIPFTTSIYRLYQFINYQYFLHLVFLYTVYFMARSVTVFGYFLGGRSHAGKRQESIRSLSLRTGKNRQRKI